MVQIENPHWYSTTTGATTTTQITDDIDYPHTGLIKSLSQGIRGNYAIKSSATCFDITFADGGSLTTIAVLTGKVFRDGKLKTVTALSATDMATNYNSGTGAVDITPHATEDVYLLLVAKDGGGSNDTMVLRGSNAVTNRVPDFVEGDIPIAVIKITAGSADDSAATSDRLVQFLTTSKVSNDLSIGYDSSGYTEMSKISAASGGTTVEVGTAGGDFIIDNTDADKKIVARLGSDTTATAFEVRNNSDAAKFAVDGSGVTDIKSLKVGTAGELTITESSDDIYITNTVSNKDIIFRVNDDGTADQPVMTISGSAQKVRITSQVTGTGNGPKLELLRDPSDNGTADGDDLGLISFLGADHNNTEQEYVRIMAEIVDETHASEDSQLFIRTMKGGSLVYNLKFTPTQTMFNADNEDIDVRIDGAADYLFYADSSADAIGIGTNAPANRLQVSHTAADGDNGIMIVREDTSTADGDLLGGIGFDSTDGNVPSSVLESSAFIASLATEDHGTGDKGGNLKLGVSLIDENDDVVSTTLASIGPPDTTANATCHAGFNSRATTAIVAAATYAPTIGDSGTLVIFKHANSNLTLPSVNNDTSAGVQFTVFNETGSDISAQIAVSNSATINGGAASALDDIESYKAATFVCSGNNTWIRIG